MKIKIIHTYYPQEWVEISRWIKYQETVEPEGNRWSKPHVSTPTLQGKVKSIIGRILTLHCSLHQDGLEGNRGAELLTYSATESSIKENMF